MDEKLTKKKLDDMIGEEKLFTKQLHHQIMDKVNHPQKVNRFISMQRFVPTVILLVLILVAGSYFFLVLSNNNNQEASPDIPLNTNPNIPLEQSGNGNNGDVLQETPVYLAANKNELSELDYEKAFELCARALTDYYFAIRNDIDINLNSFIDNESLKQYMQKKIQYEKRGWSKVKTIEIENWEIEYKDDADGGFLYLKLPAHIKFYYDGGFGETHEFLVRNVNGKLVIVDWYNGGKDSYDFLVRGENEIIDNPNIWNDQEWVNNLFLKQKEGSNVEISKINISSSKEFGIVNTDYFAVYEDKETLETLQNAFTKAVRVGGMVDMIEPEFDLEVIYKDGNKQEYHLWLGERDKKSTIMKVEDTHFIYTISEEATNLLINLIK